MTAPKRKPRKVVVWVVVRADNGKFRMARETEEEANAHASLWVGTIDYLVVRCEGVLR
jgi:hypothetical protein